MKDYLLIQLLVCSTCNFVLHEIMMCNCIFDDLLKLWMLEQLISTKTEGYGIYVWEVSKVVLHIGGLPVVVLWVAFELD